MDFLENMHNRESYLARIPKASTGPLAMEKAALKNFEAFCEWKFHVSIENMLIALRKYQGTRQENTIYEVLQNFANYIHEDKNITIIVAKSYTKRIKNYLNYMLDTKIHNEDLKQNIRYPREEKRSDYPLSAEEARKILNEAKNRRLAYLFMIGTGISDGEHLHLRKRDFSFGTRIKVSVPSSYRKVRAPKITFVPKWIEADMTARLDKLKDDDLVFRKKSEWIGANNIEVNFFRRVRKRAGLEHLVYSSGTHKITIHSFRSWFITRANRIDHGLGNALAGHGYYMKRYDRYTEQEMLEFFIKAENLLNPNIDEEKDRKTDELIGTMQARMDYMEDEIERLKKDKEFREENRTRNRTKIRSL
jgi:integrase